MARILIVDDELDIRLMLADILEDVGHTIHHAANAKEALQEIESNILDIIILDIWLTGSHLDGIGVLKTVRHMRENIPVIMISGHGNIETAVQTIKEGAYDFIEKPFKAEKLLIVLDRALNAAKLQMENSKLKAAQNTGFNFIATAKNSIACKEQAKQAATNKSRVLIVGDSGVGKQALAYYIHTESARGKNAFIKLNCASLNEDNFDAIILGKADAPGILDQAYGGTLFLDEIAHLPLTVQLKLLKIIQENSFIRNGKKYICDFRLISTSSYDPAELLQTEIINQSFYYRVNLQEIHLANLKQRQADIQPLFDYFAEHFSKTLDLPLISLSPCGLKLLMQQEWQGNIRQLKNLVEWLVIMFAKNVQIITADKIPINNIINNVPISNNDNEVANDRFMVLHQHLMRYPLKDARDLFEKDYIIAQLERFSGNISETAKFIGMERTALHRKLKTLNIKCS